MTMDFHFSAIRTGGSRQEQDQDEAERLIRMLADLLDKCSGNTQQDEWSDITVS